MPVGVAPSSGVGVLWRLGWRRHQAGRRCTGLVGEVNLGLAAHHPQRLGRKRAVDDEGLEGEVGIGMKDVHALGGRVK